MSVVGLHCLGHLEVLVGHRAIRDARVDERHVHRSVPEQFGDRLKAHAPVDGLSGQRVAQLVRMDVFDPGRLATAAT